MKVPFDILIKGGETLETSIFKCINRYGATAEYTKIVEFELPSMEFHIIVLEIDEHESFWKYNTNQKPRILYELNEDELRFAIDTYEMLKNLAITSLWG